MYHTKSESHVNLELWVMMVCQRLFIDCNKCTPLWGILIMVEVMYIPGEGVGRGAAGNFKNIKEGQKYMGGG